MSLLHEGIAWRVQMTGLKKLVLLYIYRDARLSTMDGYLTHQQIAHECGMSESAVRKFVDELEREGYFERLLVPGRGLHYRLALKEQV